MLVQAVIRQMREAGLDTEFVMELRMLEAVMERWARQGRPEGAEALVAAQQHLAAALKCPSAPRKSALHQQRYVCGRKWRAEPCISGPPALVGLAACKYASKDTLDLLTCLCAGWEARSVQ